MTPGALLSLGSINADFEMRTEQPLQAGETLIGKDFRRLSGGKAANRAFLAHRLGHSATLLGCVGDDELAEQALGSPRRAGLPLEHVTRARGVATAVSVIAVPPDGKKSILLATNANDCWDPAATRDTLAAIAAAPAGSVLTLDCEIALGVPMQAARAAAARGLVVVLDPAPPARAERELLGICTALSPDAREAAEITGIECETPEDAGRAAQALLSSDMRLSCVKLGDGGCVAALRGGRLIHVPPVPVEVVDATGAGDAFTGALGVALLEGQELEGAVVFATAASHCAVTAMGSQESYPAREAIEAMVHRLAPGLRELQPVRS